MKRELHRVTEERDILNMAAAGLSPGMQDEVRIHHRLFSIRAMCRCLCVQPSGTYLDNAVVESFFNLLKRERIRRKVYRARDEARRDTFDYIEMYYNSTRKHARNGILPRSSANGSTKRTSQASRKLGRFRPVGPIR